MLNSGNRPYPHNHDAAFWDASPHGNVAAEGVAPSQLKGYGYDAMDVAPPQEYAAHVNAQKAIADVMWAQGPSYPDKDYYEKLVGAGYALGLRDANDHEVYQVKKAKPVQYGKAAKTFYECLQDFTRQLTEQGYEIPKDITFSKDGLRRITSEFGLHLPDGANTLATQVMEGKIQLSYSGS